MSDTQYKAKSLLGLDPAYPAIGGLAPNTPCRWSPFGALMRAQDTIPASSRRVVAEWSLSGNIDWAQPDGTLDPGSPGGGTPQRYPLGSTWRTLGTYRANVTPGCELRARVLYCPAGLTQENPGGGYVGHGAWAKLRVGTTWTATPGGASAGPYYRSISMEGSTLGTYGGLENSVAGSNWTSLKMKDIADLRIPTLLTDSSDAVLASEWDTVQVVIQVQGGARVVHVVVYEHPILHVQAHDNASLKSVHAMPAGLAPLTAMPQTKPPDGTTYDENRFGVTQTMQVAERQSERLGPRILHLTSHDEKDATIYAQADVNPFTTSSASFVDIYGAGATSWSPENPAWIVASSNAKLHRTSDPDLIMRGGVAAAIPVRVRVDASQSAGTGTVRVQSSDCEWVDVSITSAVRGWVTVTGYLRAQTYGDEHVASLQCFVRCTAGTLSVYGISVDFGSWTL